MIKKSYAYTILLLSKIFNFEINNSKYTKIRIVNWILNGSDKLRIDYAFDNNSVGFDLGVYRGDFVASIFQNHNCNIYVFEPFSEYFLANKKRFESNSKVKSYDYGLSNKNTTEKLYISEEG